MLTILLSTENQEYNEDNLILDNNECNAIANVIFNDTNKIKFNLSKASNNIYLRKFMLKFRIANLDNL